ncbi:putative polygalacturonase [Phytophthora cinnamomi]|uniref:putative polygalacturonase n=1 Tax=Phytophthora cinnamomi TaxID=4785 RepID=UPI00355A7FEF|nr:putative polygalacturonase [Phytophthora cinnamomi]UKP15088.1 polygalacturonase [Phytophthora cinnamomi]
MAKTGTTTEFVDTSRFGTLELEGPLVRVSGADLTVKGSGVLDRASGTGSRVSRSHAQCSSKLQNAVSSTVSGFTVKRMPPRTSSKDMMLRNLTIDNRTGNDIAKNTDSFDFTKNDHITTTGNKIHSGYSKSKGSYTESPTTPVNGLRLLRYCWAVPVLWR